MIHVEETQEDTDSIHEEDEQYHNNRGYEKPNRKKKKPNWMGDYVINEDKPKDKMASK